MKINIVVPFVELTGGIKIIFTYANELVRRGHDVMIYYPFIPYAMDKPGVLYIEKFLRTMAKGIIKKQWQVNWFELNAPYKMVLQIKNSMIRDADIVIATAWPTAYDVDKLSPQKGKKIYFIQSYEIWSGPKAMVDGSYLLPLKQIVIAGWLKDLMAKEFSNENAEIVYNGIDFHEFYPNKSKSYNNDPIRILLLAHPVALKGMADGIKAFEFLQDKYNIRLVMFGTGYFDAIPKYAEFHNNPSKHEIRELYASSDIYIFPSWSEGWGLTVIEAMACKCAVVGNNVGCLLDVGIHKETAMLSEPHDVESIKNNLEILLKDRKLLRLISENGYNAVKRFSWDLSFNKFEEILSRNANK